MVNEGFTHFKKNHADTDVESELSMSFSMTAPNAFEDEEATPEKSIFKGY
jgi:hypothetical protein